jgi:hypothetical protein
MLYKLKTLHHNYNSFFLSDVFLENTFTNGKWITANDTEWPVAEVDDTFVLTETLHNLKVKAGLSGGAIKKHSIKKRRSKRKSCKINGGNVPYTLYSSRVKHYVL